MTELQEMRLPILEARANNRAKDNKNKALTEGRHNKSLRRLSWAIQMGLTTKKEMMAAKKELDALEAAPPRRTSGGVLI